MHIGCCVCCCPCPGLYNELGQHNPKKAKAERQRVKKAKADFASFAAAAGDGDFSSDFDFDEANVEQGLATADSEVRGPSSLLAVNRHTYDSLMS